MPGRGVEYSYRRRRCCCFLVAAGRGPVVVGVLVVVVVVVVVLVVPAAQIVAALSGRPARIGVVGGVGSGLVAQTHSLGYQRDRISTIFEIKNKLVN